MSMRMVSSVCLLVLCLRGVAADQPATVEALTTGPKFHWFGYYDKFQFDPSDRYVLSMEVDFEGRSPKKDDVIKVGMVDLQDNKKWIELGETRSWCWQQGCMLQWRPKSDTEVLWNDRDGDRFVCRVLDVKTRKMRTLPYPIYHLSPDGKYALGTDFSRLQDQRPGYGYPGIPDKYKDLPAPNESTIYRMDLDTGERTDLISLADIAKIRYKDKPVGGKLHFNHIQWSRTGKRFFFLNRVNGNKGTHAYTANPDGREIRYLGKDSSHFEWRDDEYVTIWARGAYRLYKDDGSGNNEIMWKMGNGHQSYLTDRDWLITDTYPQGKKREQIVYLYHLPTKKRIDLGRFPQPTAYRGEWRCDTHPRLNRACTKAVIDSPHEGNGRQLYMIDISVWKK